MAAECHIRTGFRFQPKLTLDFAGGEITTDAGVLLLREFDERRRLTARLPQLVEDGRDRRYVRHAMIALLRQRIYQIAAGYEDCNDATYLRHDPTLRAVVHRQGAVLASQPTLSRFENDVAWDSIRLLEHEGTEWYCRYGGVSRRSTRELVLDMDSTEDPTHGQQAFSFFNAYYDGYMYHPLLIFEAASGVLLAGRLRPGNAGGIRQALPLLRPLLKRLRAHFPKRPLALRADSDFAKPELLDFAEYTDCLYVFGMPRNPKLEAHVERWRQRAERQWARDAEHVRLYTSFQYKTQSWSQARRIVAKVERTAEGMNLRFVVTNRREPSREVFDWYEQRGQAENFIKELKNDVEADRLSCTTYRANAFRLQLHALAYNLIVLFRRTVLAGTELARSTIGSVRLRLFKVAARVRHSCRRLWFHLASGWPHRLVFIQVCKRLSALPPSG